MKIHMADGAKPEPEWQTRKRRIDPRLDSAGWSMPAKGRIGIDRAHRLEEFATAEGPADYALFVGDQPLGIVEAKRVSLGPEGVLTQAERYSRGFVSSPFNFDGMRVPFVFSSNGEKIWFRDVRDSRNLSREIAQFHTPSALRELLERDFGEACARLRALPNDHHRLRPYQKEANTEIEEAIAGRKRHMLVAMATGTGKTFTMVNEVYRLMKSGVAKRILFLVDRRSLAAQATRAFAAYEPERGLKFDQIYEVYSQRFRSSELEGEPFDPKVLPTGYLTMPSSRHAFVYVCTIQRMAINLLGRNAVPGLPGEEEVDEDAEQIPDIPIHAFDLVIADECHRGYTSQEISVWRSVLDYFDAIKIGLTATPAAHTTGYFTEVVYRYEYEQAVREGFLVDYNAVKIRSDVRINGVFLKEGDPVSMVDPETGVEQMDLLEDERQFDSTEVEARVTAPDSNHRILQEVKRYADEHERDHGRCPKTLIFAVHDLPHTSHADQLVRLARKVFGRGESFVQKITGRVDRPLQRIREFRNRPEPGIVVTVDMLSTGVDIPDLEFIVLLRPVKSRILFEQMLGRGTRKGELHPDKSHFTVFDCFDGTLLEYFRNSTAITADAPAPLARTIPQIVEDIWANRDRDYNTRVLVKRMQRVAKAMSGEAVPLFVRFIPDGDLGRFAKDLPSRLGRDFVATMQVLRDADFQELLLNYPRPRRAQFLVAAGYADHVSSEELLRDPMGRTYKPEDYLAAFGRFVRDARDQVEAIGILLDRPQEWSPRALTELRSRLTYAPEHFTEERLRQAHERCYHKALVDLISMVKHAAAEEQPLLTAEERVDRALAKITDGKEISDDQLAWLDRIRAHLISNLSIEQEDFEIIPALNRDGGWGVANRIFQGRLADLLRDLNATIAA
jgi:type I restriction enzyme R subunit